MRARLVELSRRTFPSQAGSGLPELRERGKFPLSWRSATAAATRGAGQIREI